MSSNTSPEYSIETDPLFQPISDDKKKKIDEAVEKKIKSLTLDENVEKDTSTVHGQNYALISIVSPNSTQKSDNHCLKIKGVFNTIEEANKHAEMLQKIDSTFDIYVVEMYSWLLIPPDPELLEQVHVDTKLNEIIAGHRDSQLKSKMYFEERKRELMENIEIENKEKTELNKKEREENEANKSKIEEIEPNGVQAESSVNISNNGENCPTTTIASSSTSPTELMDAMVNEPPLETPRKAWADDVEED
jgi:hypothetical protein